MTQRPRFVSTLLAAILGLSTLGAPLPASAAIARPTNLRPVQSKADCATALSLAAVVCDAAVKAGDLQLIWDESDKTVAGYKVYQFGAGGNQLLGTSTGTARYYLVKKPPEGYANLCFAVQAYVGSQTSPDSLHYCYAPGATASTRSFKPSHTATQVTWNAPTSQGCGANPPFGAANFRSADTKFGSAFTAFFPWLLKNPQSANLLSGRRRVGGVYVGNEAGIIHPYGPCSTATVTVNALAGAAFDLGALAHHKLYSASLTLNASQTVGFASGKATLSNGGWCPIWVGAANREWWLAPLGNLTSNKSGRVQVASSPTTDTDVTSLASAWGVKYNTNNYGFVIEGNPPSGGAPTTSNACLTKFSTPSLQIVYF
ncbi:MAG TPA: hypothetical protein VKT83_05515 [bacterium]|nr:hypothetical protein [bacterium]